ncbi:hypothetical protein VTK56DRAFT_861 [Thermocarpiscus australiensis]
MTREETTRFKRPLRSPKVQAPTDTKSNNRSDTGPKSPPHNPNTRSTAFLRALPILWRRAGGRPGWLRPRLRLRSAARQQHRLPDPARLIRTGGVGDGGVVEAQRGRVVPVHDGPRPGKVRVGKVGAGRRRLRVGLEAVERLGGVDMLRERPEVGEVTVGEVVGCRRVGLVAAAACVGRQGAASMREAAATARAKARIEGSAGIVLSLLRVQYWNSLHS